MSDILPILSDRVYLLFIAITYLSASVPYGLVVAKFYGVGNLRDKGSGNIGMTNVMRVVGKKAGIYTFLLDFFKAFLPVAIYVYLFEIGNPAGGYLLAAIAVFGHTRSIFLKFKGGKGVACLFGVFAALFPLGMLMLALLWLVLYKLSGISSIGGLSVAVLSPLITYYLHGFSEALWVHIFLSLYIIILHKENIGRLIRGEELFMRK